MKRIAVLTSGGDAPGMNGAIRAVVRTGIGYGWEVFGVCHGYAGLISGEMAALSARDVGGILQRGGTILGSARSAEFETVTGREKAIRNLNTREIEALVVIGGNGSQTGAHCLFEMGFPVVGVASTIDNDLAGCDISIGVDTALNIALEAIDRLKTTASSHQRAFLVGVMGRRCGYLALAAAIAGGATFQLSVTGTGFISGSQVQWNGSTVSVTTTYLGPTQLLAQVPGTLISTAGTAYVSVVNNPGGVTSNVVASLAGLFVVQ